MSCLYNQNDEQKRLYLQNMFRNDAARFYATVVESHWATYQIAIKLPSAQYSLLIWHTQFLDYLAGLSVDTLVSTGLNLSAALAKVYAEIVLMPPQLSSSHRGYSHSIRFFWRAVYNELWSYSALQRVASSGLSFQQLHREPESALQICKEGTNVLDKTAYGKRETEALLNYVFEGRCERRRYNTQAPARRSRETSLTLLVASTAMRRIIWQATVLNTPI